MRSGAKRLIHDSPMSIRIQPADNHERGPSRFASMAVPHAFENCATNLGTSLRGSQAQADPCFDG
jgi:hypothetical protein